MNKDSAYKVMFGLVFAIGAFSLTWMFNMNAKIAVMASENSRIEKLEKTASKHWKLHSWSKDELTRLGVEHGFTVKSWPDLD